MTTKQQQRHRQERFLFLLMGCITLGLLVVGYFLYHEHLSGKPEESRSSPAASGQSQPVMTPAELHEASFGPDEGQVITLYFPAQGKDHLVKESRKIVADKMVLTQARSLIRELLRGPFQDTSRPTFPEGTQLRSLFYSKGTFLVDFSSEIIDNHPGGALEEALTVFSLVNTLTELDPRAKVQILVNGQEQETLRGHMGLDHPFSRYESLLVDPTGS